MTIATVMKNCISELFLLIVIWTMGVIVFAMLMYSFEEKSNPDIVSGTRLVLLSSTEQTTPRLSDYTRYDNTSVFCILTALKNVK